MESMVKLITESNKLKSENEELKNTCLEYEEFKKSMAVCRKENNELILKYKNRKAELLKKLETMEKELAKKKRVFEKLIKENRNLKEELSQIKQNPNQLEYNETKRTEDTHNSNKDLSGKKKTSYLDKKEMKNPPEAGNKKTVFQTIKQHYRSYTCDVCDKKYKYRQSILYHVRRVHSAKKLKPNKLETEETEACHKDIKKNLDTAELEKPQAMSEQKVLKSAGKIGNNHIISNASASYSCDKCNQIFKSKGQEKRHITKKHPKIPRNGQMVFEVTYTCEKCKKKFKYESIRDNHVKKMHSENKKFNCKFCTVKTTKRYNYRRHLLRFHSHENDPEVQDVIKSCFLSKKNEILPEGNNKITYTCEKCETMFKYKRLLNNHIKNMHSESNKFNCKFCTAQIATGYNYRRHLLRFHSHEKDPEVQDLIKSFFLPGKNKILPVGSKMIQEYKA